MKSRYAAPIFAVLSATAPLLGRAANARADDAAGAAEAEARSHFDKGNGHLRKEEYPEAYEEFRKSLEAKRTRAAMAAVASALKQLGRYDEALTLYEQALLEFPSPSAVFQAKVAGEVKELQGLVGTISLTGDAPAGATLSVDAVLRGKLPLTSPLRLSQGLHQIRVDKEGFEPILTRVEVTAREQAVVQLVAPSKKGKIVVREKHGWPLHVELDGKTVGQTPWEGLVAVGEHRVRLFGHLAVEALLLCEVQGGKPGEKGREEEEGAKMESVVETAGVQLYEVKEVVLGADEQDASLKIESTPKGARLWIDAKEVGQTPWEGRLGLGEHAIQVAAKGFVTAHQAVQLERRKQREVTMLLEREPDLGALQRSKDIRNVSAALSYGVGLVSLGVGAVTGALAFSKADELRRRCGGTSCSRDQEPELDAARTFSTVSTVGFVVGGAGAVAGTLSLFLLGPRAKERKVAALWSGASGASFGEWKVGLGVGRFQIEGSF